MGAARSPHPTTANRAYYIPKVSGVGWHNGTDLREPCRRGPRPATYQRGAVSQARAERKRRTCQQHHWGDRKGGQRRIQARLDPVRSRSAARRLFIVRGRAPLLVAADHGDVCVLGRQKSSWFLAVAGTRPGGASATDAVQDLPEPLVPAWPAPMAALAAWRLRP